MMADMKLENQRQYMRSLGISLEEVKDQNLGIAVEDRAPLPEDKSKRERFVLLKRNDPDYYPYYTIRAQNDYTKI